MIELTLEQHEFEICVVHLPADFFNKYSTVL